MKRLTVILLALLLVFAILPTMTPVVSLAEELEPFCTVRNIPSPVAGHFPASLFKNPYKPNTITRNGFLQTLTWSPEIVKTFEVNTEYTVTLRLTPDSASYWNTAFGTGTARSFAENSVTPDIIAGLPTENVKSMTYSYDGIDMLINIKFYATGFKKEVPDVIFFDDFSGTINPYNRGQGLTTQFARGPQDNRSDLAAWRNDMSWIDQENNQLVIAFQKDPSLTRSTDPYIRDNFVRSGCARTRSQSPNTEIYFENAFGYYEANIKFPKISGWFAAFWLMYTAPNSDTNSGEDSTEIDIVENYNNPINNGFNAAFHWDGYGNAHKEVCMETDATITGVNIYDGEFHTFALEWSPTDYIWYVDGIEFASYQKIETHTYDYEDASNNWDSLRPDGQGICQNPNYIKFSAEAATWACEKADPNVGVSADSGEMIIDYVYVLNGPKPAAGELEPEPEPFCTVRDIPAPVAGHFPAGLYKNPYKANTITRNGFTQTITWSPEITKTFDVNTEYTATLRLSPDGSNWNTNFPGKTASFAANNILPVQILGLPTEGVKAVSYSYEGADMLLNITFEPTSDRIIRPDIIFFDDFSGTINPYNRSQGLTTEFVRGPQDNRQDMSAWRNNMSWIDEENDQMVLAFQRDPSLTNSSNAYIKNNFIRSGAARTRSQSPNTNIYFETTYGYFEAKIKFPQVSGMWGAFWLMYTASNSDSNSGVDSTEIDIVETYLNPRNNGFNAGFHWDGYGNAHKEVSMETDEFITGVNIYDGEFHTFGFEWSPTDYIFYVDDIEYASYQKVETHTWDFVDPTENWSSLRLEGQGICQNPNYIKLSIEAATWAGAKAVPDVGLSADSGEMRVDYVYVLNGPKPGPEYDKLAAAIARYQSMAPDAWKYIRAGWAEATQCYEDAVAVHDDVGATPAEAAEATENLLIALDDVKLVKLAYDPAQAPSMVMRKNMIAQIKLDTNAESLTFTSSNPALLTVTSTGVMTAKSIGVAVVQIKDHNTGYTINLVVNCTN